MKKILKVFFVAFASVILIVLFTSGVLLWIVFTPERLTPIVVKQSEKYIPYRTGIGEVELTFFSTFPKFGIKVSGLTILSPFPGAPSDTLFSAKNVTGVLDAGAYRKSGEVIINKFILTESKINLFKDSAGASNYELFLTDYQTGTSEPAGTGYGFVDLEDIRLRNFSFSYIDLPSGIFATAGDIYAGLSGNLEGDRLSGRLNVSNCNISFEYDGERYLDDAAVKLNMPASIDISRQFIETEKAFASLNGMGISLSGSVLSHRDAEGLTADLSYTINPWQIDELLALVPGEMLSFFGNFTAAGTLVSNGKVNLTLTDSLLYLADINIVVEDGSLTHEYLHHPISELGCDIRIYSDFRGDNSAFVDIASFEARTPDSFFKTNGRIDNLFADMHYDLVSDADILLEELLPFIPPDMSLDMSGRVKGRLKKDFTMSQALNLELDRVIMSGSAQLSGLNVLYDTLAIATNKAKIDFSFPNNSSRGENTKFAFFQIISDHIEAGASTNLSTSMVNPRLVIEMSDIRDTTVIPDLFCTFNLDLLEAEIDTFSISLNRPLGYFTLSPGREGEGLPFIELACDSYALGFNMGQNQVSTGSITVRTEIINDRNQDDVFLQWIANGMLELEDGEIVLSEIPYPVIIPSIKMDFDPETFSIRESLMNIDRSDFALSGVLTNVLSYFRGDSLLRGDFSFVSASTDLTQIMNLTSGIGVEDVVDRNGDGGGYDNISGGLNNSSLHGYASGFQNGQGRINSSNSNNDSFSGPYMVPQGIDLILRADIRQATLGTDTARNIIGDVRISDGILVLDGLTFTTPAADMQLTAMYRTPRKNHLYLGLDYHMFDVEISRLLDMIPDIDTLLPMLRSFEGTGEFHIAVETYLDSLYNVKNSTLRGASSIRGQNLVLMDGETFTEIARTLRFSRRARNLVDSLSAEFTIFREEIDIYPFLIVMDRYKAVVAGRHNLDMSFDYHISLVESPLPVRLGIDITGTMDNLQYRLASARYAEFYRPVARSAVAIRQLELRKIIRESLIKNIRQ